MTQIPALDFERPDFSAPSQGAVVCNACRQPVVQSYYEVNGQVMCSACREALEQGRQGSRLARVARATGAGIGVGILGALVWWGVRKLTGYELGIISIAIGIGVGKAVRWGSRARGGWAYQVLAILLTYLSITANYVPEVIQGMIENSEKQEQTATATPTAKSPAPAATTAAKPAPVKASAASSPLRSAGLIVVGLIAILALAAAAPIMAGAGNILGLLIIGFGLYEAWKLNRAVPLTINGPYSVAPSANG